MKEYTIFVTNQKNSHKLTMLPNYSLLNFNVIALITQSQIIIALIIVVIFFGIILLLGLRKSFLLKKENDRLEKMDTTIKDDENYKDFTDGHMYGGN